MCDCNEKKPCCDCLKGGCECICDCTCHTDGSDQFPRLSCPTCITESVAAKALSAAMDKIDPALLPDEKEIKRMLDTLPL